MIIFWVQNETIHPRPVCAYAAIGKGEEKILNVERWYL